jgi:hypothetical protein
MVSRMLTVAIASAFLLGAAASAPVHAEAAKKEEKKEAKKKELTPQQQKMKDCAVKWNDEKKAKKVSGKKAHNAFMSTCLKG